MKVKSKNTTNAAILGATIQQARKAKGLSRQRLCELSGVSTTFLYDLEHGLLSNPSMRHVEKVAHVLGIDLPLLLSLSSEQDSQEVVLRFSLPKGVQLTVAEMKHAKQVMQEVLNALAKTQSGRGGGDAGGTDQA